MHPFKWDTTEQWRGPFLKSKTKIVLLYLNLSLLFQRKIIIIIIILSRVGSLLGSLKLRLSATWYVLGSAPASMALGLLVAGQSQLIIHPLNIPKSKWSLVLVNGPILFPPPLAIYICNKIYEAVFCKALKALYRFEKHGITFTSRDHTNFVVGKNPPKLLKLMIWGNPRKTSSPLFVTVIKSPLEDLCHQANL